MKRSSRARNVGALFCQPDLEQTGGCSPELTVRIGNHDVGLGQQSRQTDLDHFAILDRHLLSVRENDTSQNISEQPDRQLLSTL